MSEDYQWHFDYTRLVRDTGFIFQLHQPKSSIKTNIANIDVERVLVQQDIALIDRNINTVLEYTLDNEQSTLLDPTFVKVFYISQLCIQYLLFCKKYLDSTVVHLKQDLEQNVNNLKQQIKELQSTLNCQIASVKSVPIFQCKQCPKVFSAEEYLYAHIQRRHESLGNGTLFQVETDKLQSEIKALKERLNNTEKFIHYDDGNIKKNSQETIENTSLTELQHKFELLKIHVDNELRILQTQKFDQEKYEKWFETFLNKLDYHNNGNNAQLEISAPTKIHIHSDHSVLVPEIALEKIEIMLQEKVTGSIEKLENRMQTFCDKIQEFEKHSLNIIANSNLNPNHSLNEEMKVVPKPRKKWNTPPASDSIHNINAIRDSPKITERVLEKKEVQTEVKIDSVVVKETNSDASEISVKKPAVAPEYKKIKKGKHNVRDDESTSESESKTDSEIYKKAIAPVKPKPYPRLCKKSFSSLKNNTISLNQRNSEKDVIDLLNEQLANLGISSDWSRLPINSYNKAYNIVNQQTHLLKKMYPDYNKIRDGILKTVDQKLKEVSTSTTMKIHEAPNTSSNFKRYNKFQKMKMYDTDSETETDDTIERRKAVMWRKGDFVNQQQAYYKVIQEFNLKRSNNGNVSEISLDTDVSPEKEDGNVKTELTKSVLKNYPSVGSLHKKKVLFNLKTSDKSSEGGKIEPTEYNDSTSSVSSSVLDGSKGATPATIAILGGRIKVGLTSNQLNELADVMKTKAIKTSRRDFGYVLSNKLNGGTTVAGTLIVAKEVGIPVFGTGGLGGVHREVAQTFDISADLIELGKSPVAVISSGIKSILDISKTLEYLETQGVFVATFGNTKTFPAFYCGASECKAPYNVKTASEAANVIKCHFELNLRSGLLFAVAVPAEYEMDSKEMNKVIEDALLSAKEKGIAGKEITPYLLAHISKMTKGLSLKTNIELIKNNARVAADIAVELTNLKLGNALKTGGNANVNEDKRPETQGVFVATFGNTKTFPAFYCGASECKAPYNVKTASEAANVIKCHFELNLRSGLLFAVAVPAEYEMDSKEMNKVIEDALLSAKEKGIAGKEITPYLLAHISKMTKGLSLKTSLGGVHREVAQTFDISADLIELGKSPVAVISSGIKSILDISKTLEYLETQGVFVATFGNTKTFPAFYCGASECKAPYNVKTASEAANVIKCHFELNLRSGLLFAVAVPAEYEMDSKEMNKVIEDALLSAKEKGIAGKEITPYLLAQISKMTKGLSLKTSKDLYSSVS
ncbi:hypothetical protein FQA39_LY15542 [Lamprigera yunnana]|nr:hypothetical protein FQA39_LY15542 [Lamprigera yunnana]